MAEITTQNYGINSNGIRDAMLQVTLEAAARDVGTEIVLADQAECYPKESHGRFHRRAEVSVSLVEVADKEVLIALADGAGFELAVEYLQDTSEAQDGSTLLPVATYSGFRYAEGSRGIGEIIASVPLPRENFSHWTATLKPAGAGTAGAITGEINLNIH